MTAAPGTVAVVIPTKNGAHFIGDTIRSVLSQSRQADDIVVVDDGSTDDTTAIVRAFDSVRLLPNSGRGSNPARATGTAATASEYVAFLDHDDIWFPHHLETLVGLLDRWPQSVLAHSHLKKFRTQLETEPASNETPRLTNLWDTFPTSHVGGPSSVVVRRSALEQIGGWPTWARVPSDIYVWFRLADLGPFARWPAFTAGWRRHDSSMSVRRNRDDPVGYARDRLGLLREALDIHLAGQPEEAERLTGRLNELSELVEILSVICLGNVEELREILEGFVRRDRPSADLIPYAPLVLFIAIDVDPVVRRNFWRCYRAWPRDHRDLRRLIADPVVAKAVLSGARRHPRHPSQWGIPLTPSVRHAVRPLMRRMAGAGWRRVSRRG